MPRGQGKETVRSVMHDYKYGNLHSGSKKGPIVDRRDQAIAIALSEAGLSNKSKQGKRRTSRR